MVISMATIHSFNPLTSLRFEDDDRPISILDGFQRIVSLAPCPPTRGSISALLYFGLLTFTPTPTSSTNFGLLTLTHRRHLRRALRHRVCRDPSSQRHRLRSTSTPGSFGPTASFLPGPFVPTYLSISFSFASYPCTLLTPAFADGAVQIYQSHLHYRFPLYG